jgi:hypothetical protein
MALLIEKDITLFLAYLLCEENLGNQIKSNFENRDALDFFISIPNNNGNYR